MEDRLSQGISSVTSSSFFNGEIVAEPFSLFAQMRARGDVVQVFYPYEHGPQKAWIVTRMEEASHVLKDHQRFTRQWEADLCKS